MSAVVPPPPPSTILVAHADLAVVSQLKQTLSPQYHVEAHGSGETVLERAFSTAPPTLLLVQSTLPGLSGWEMCTILKFDPRTANLPILLLIKPGEVQDEGFGIDLGVADYITLPPNPGLTLARVRTHLALASQEEHLQGMLVKAMGSLESTQLALLDMLARVGRLRDGQQPYPAALVRHLARWLGRQAGMNESEGEILFQATALYDLGKLAIPDRIYQKPDVLDDAEWHEVRQHAERGAELIGFHESPLLEWARLIALTHHERWDGKGYPLGMKGNEIPLAARVVAIVDCFCGLLANRPQRKAWTVEESFRHIHAESGQQFDPKLVQLFVDGRTQVEQLLRQHRPAGPH